MAGEKGYEDDLLSVCSLFRDGQTTFASYYAEQEVATNKRIKEMNELYKGLLGR